MNNVYKILFIISIITSIITGNILNFDQVILNSFTKSLKLVFHQGSTIIIWSGFLNVLIKQPFLERLSKKLLPIIHLIFPNLSFNSHAKKYLITNLIVNLIGIGPAGTSSALQAIEKLKVENDYFTIMNLTILNTTSLSIIPLSLISYRKILNGNVSFRLLICHFLITCFSFIIVIFYNHLLYKRYLKC